MRLLTSVTLAALVAVTATAGFAYWYLSNTLEVKPLPAAALAVEAALADSNSVGLMHIDVAHIVEADRSLLGEEDREALLSPLPLEGSIVAKLRHRGVDLRDSLKQVFGSLVVTPEGPAGAMVFLGELPVEIIEATIRESYVVEEKKIGAFDTLMLTHQDSESCELSAPVAVHLAKNRIVIASPEIVDGLLQRLAMPGGSDTLPQWRKYREGKIFSLGLFIPPMAVMENVDSPMLRMFSGAAEEKTAGIENIYAGASIETIPPSLTFETRVENSDSGWAKGEAALFRNWQQGIDSDFAESLPSLTRLIRNLTVTEESAALVVVAELDKAAIKDFSQLPVEIIKAMFSGGGISGSGETPVPADQEQILPPDNVTQFIERASHGDLAPFDDEANQNFKADGTTGPFGIRVKSLRLSEADPDVVEIEFAATSGKIPNMGEPHAGFAGNDEAHGELFISAVRDKSGQDTLRAETCGKERNSIGGPLSANTQYIYVNNDFVQIPVLQGDKAVRLVEGATLGELSKAEGFVRLRLPTQTKSHLLTAPFEGQVIETDRARIKFGDGAPNGLKYEVSGDPRAILTVRALNASKAYLAGAGSYSSGRFLGSGKSVGKNYQGQPAFAEVIVAERETGADYPFILESVTPQFNVWDYPAAFQVATQDAASFISAFGKVDSAAACEDAKSDPALEPFALCMNSMRPSWGDSLQGQFILAAPNAPALAENLSGIEVALSSITVEGGDAPLEVTHQEFVVLPIGFNGDKPYIDQNGYMLIEGLPGLEEAKITAVSGQLTVRFPLELERLSLDVTELGNVASRENGPSVRLVAIEDGSLRIEMTGSRDTLVQFIPKDREGKVLATNNERVEPGKAADQWVGSLRVSGVPASVDIVYAAKQSVMERPFSLSIE